MTKIHKSTIAYFDVFTLAYLDKLLITEIF